MITHELAVELSGAGLAWHPVNGDRFMIPKEDLAQHVFLLSDMTIEVERLPGGSGLMKFNGTTEWALDSIEQGEVVWLPREDQLRTELGERLVSLTRIRDTWVLTLDLDGEEVRFSGGDVECLYAEALLQVLRQSAVPG